MTNDSHLLLNELILAESREWKPSWTGWLVVYVVEGDIYWLRNNEPRLVEKGSLLVLQHGSGDFARASSLGKARLKFFVVNPSFLSGIFLLDELVHLEKVASHREESLILVEPGNPLSLQAFEILNAHPVSQSPQSKLKRVELWMGVLAMKNILEPKRKQQGETPTLPERFENFIKNMSLAELCDSSLPDLATKVGCSTRHIHRMFREIYGKSFREMQMNLRLSKARKYLEESDSKIINIAHETGYNHLSLFNSMFKKRFGMTPGDWRKKAQTKSKAKTPKSRRSRGLLSLALMIGFVFAMLQSVRAQGKAAPTNSAVSPTNAPAAAAEKSFEIRNYIIEGNTILKQSLLDSIFEPAKGSSITFSQVNKSLVNLQRAYAARGLVTASVSLPQQKLTNATVRVKVVEAPLAAITVTGNRYYSTRHILSKLPSLRTNTMLNSIILQRELDAANANRDYTITTLVGPGPVPDTSAMNLRVKDRFPAHGRLEIDNYNIPNSPAMRANVNAQYDNLWDMDHQLGVQYGFTPEFTKTDTSDVAWIMDQPLIANMSAYYRMPLGSQKSVEKEVDANPGRFGYNEVSRRFVAPPAQGIPTLTVYASHSTSDTGLTAGDSGVAHQDPTALLVTNSFGENTTLNNAVGSQFSYPLTELDKVKINLGAGIDFKQYRMAAHSTNYLQYTAFFTNNLGELVGIPTTFAEATNNSLSRLEYLPISLGSDLTVTDPYGVNFLHASADFNVLPVLSSDEAFLAAASKARATYLAIRMNYSREQKLYKSWSAVMRASGQFSDNSLISNEQFGLGGNGTIRGYHEGEQYGDSGWCASIEPRTPLIKFASVGTDDKMTPWQVRFSTFLDYGELFVTSPASSGPSRYHLAGTGTAATLNFGQHFGGQVTMGVPLLNTPGTQAGSIRVGFSLSAQF